MQTVSNPNRLVIVRVLRPFLMNGEVVPVGEEIQIGFIDARYLEHTSKAQIVADAPQPEAQPAADEKPAAKKGKKDA